VASTVSQGTFSRSYPAFARALRAFADEASLGNARFVARNFQLDEHVSPGRATSYDPDSAVDMSTFDTWRLDHTAYLERDVFVPQPAAGIPAVIDPRALSS
jgi:hypothetical protein